MAQKAYQGCKRYMYGKTVANQRLDYFEDMIELVDFIFQGSYCFQSWDVTNCVFYGFDPSRTGVSQ
jgi:hypothetical protein